MKKWIAGLLLVLLAIGGCALAAGDVWLPDPGPALGVAAELYMTKMENNGVTYDYYTYDLEGDVDAMGHFIVAYTEALRNIGFTPKKLSLDNAMWYESYAKGGSTAEMGVFVSSDAKSIANGGTGGWRVVLAVPLEMTFRASSGAPGLVGGNTRCIGCGGNGVCSGCGGLGTADYGSGREECVLCDGSGDCNLCDGAGSY